MEKITNLRLLLIPLLPRVGANGYQSLCCVAADGWPQGAPEMMTGHDARSVGVVSAGARTDQSRRVGIATVSPTLGSKFARTHALSRTHTAAQPPRARALYRARVV